jgi:hypothetical protein
MSSKYSKRNINKPPQGVPCVWCCHEMMASPAWMELLKHRAAFQVVSRIMVEHMRHAGLENGWLPVTYTDFVKYGVRRKSVPDGIAIAEALGFIKCTERGRASFEDLRTPVERQLRWPVGDN